MGTYRAVKANEQSIVLVHYPETTESHTIEIRNPKASWTPKIEEGKHYSVSLSVTEVSAPLPVVVEPLPNTVLHEEHLAAAAVAASEPISEVTGDTEEPVIAEDGHEAASTDETSTKTTETA